MNHQKRHIESENTGDFHVHCEICGKPYPTNTEANQCFYKHDEIDVLRHIMCEVYYQLNPYQHSSTRGKRYIKKCQSLFDKVFGGSYMRDKITRVFENYEITEPEDYLNNK